jgi:hypothetical protein
LMPTTKSSTAVSTSSCSRRRRASGRSISRQR